MPAYSNSLKKQIEQRLKDGELKSSAFIKPKSPIDRLKALGRKKTGSMNKTERAYSQYLQQLQHIGQIDWFKYESVKLRLADNTFYTVDFMVMKSNGELEAHEVKGGYIFDDAMVKVKVAADLFPWPFFIVKKANGGRWEITKVGNKE